MIVRNISVDGRKSLVWAAVVFASLQVALAVAADCVWPRLRYPEYGRKLAMLRQALAAHGTQPVLVAIGTSRTAFGFAPSTEAASTAADEWQFNFALTGQGPIQELLCLHRLLAEGIRPQRLLIEIHPPLLHQSFPYFEPGLSDIGRCTWAEVMILARYVEEPRGLLFDWLRSRCWPWHTHRRHLLGLVAPWLLTELERTDLNLTRETDGRGWSRFPIRPTDADNRRAMEEWSVGLYVEYLRHFSISSAPQRAIAEILEICRRERIEAALLLMPECERFREAYPAASIAVLDQWLGNLKQQGVAIFDCRQWCTDEEFCDGHHMLPEGARRFSTCLQSAAVRPWIATRPPSSSSDAASLR